MDDQTRRSITWVIIIAAVLIIATITSYRRQELQMLTDRIAYGTPAGRVDAVRTLVEKQKLMEAMDGEPRWVMAKMAGTIPLIDLHGAYYELLTSHGKLDAPVQTRDQSLLTNLNNRGVEILVEGIKDNEPGPRGAAKQPLINIGNHIEEVKSDGQNRVIDGCMRLLDAWDQYVRDLVRDILAGIATSNVTDRLIPVVQQMEPKRKRLPDGTMRKQTTQEFMRAKETAEATLAKMQTPAIQPIIRDLLTYENPKVRSTGCRLLGTIADRQHATPIPPEEAARVVGPLVRRLRIDPEWSVQRRAAIALGLLRDVAAQEGVVPVLIQHLSDRPSVKAAVVEALGRIGDPSAIEPLVQTLMTDRSGATAELEIAFTALGEAAIAPLGEALKSVQPEIRLIATRAVAEIGGPEAVVPLGDMLKDGEVRVRRVAAHALRDTADERVLADIAAALGDEDWQVYHAARDALSRVGSPAVPILIDSLGEEPRVSAMAHQALRRIGSPAIPALGDALSARRAGRAHWAALTMGAIGVGAVEAAASVLSDLSLPRATRTYAAEALGHTDVVGAVEPLVDALDQPEARVQLAAVEALGRIGHKRATPALVSKLADKSPLVRDRAMKVLHRWHRGEIIKHLNEMTGSDDLDAKRRAMILLVELTEMPAHELLADFGGVKSPLREAGEAPKERPAAGEVTGPEGKTSVEPKIDLAVLERAADDESARHIVRQRAARALGYAGDDGSAKALMKLLEPGGEYAAVAAFAVARIGSRQAPERAAGIRPELTPMTQSLVDLFMKATDRELRARLGAALTLVGRQASWELVEKMRDAPDKTKAWIIAVLGACSKDATEAVLTARGEAEKDELAYKRWVASALPLIGDQQALDLVAHLPDDEKPDPEKTHAGKERLELIHSELWK